MKLVIVLLFLISNVTFATLLSAQDNTCRLTAPAQDDVWVIVYDADADGNRGKIIWQGKIAAGQEIEVASTDGRIRYDFKRDPDQPYQGDISVGCFQKNSFLID
ncbi:MAG: hypothetical protein PVG51_07150 [Desulfosarcina sp.]|jgi:hypothetical protein